ncbi:MAG: DUF1963 domain-containing protein [Bacteroidales bacterium]|nr:DUF1963 domain-containing protein [Bacteroidales bacterium]
MYKPIYIHLGEHDSNLPLGASHLWGQPDMPPDYPMPEFPLICQINLSGLPDNGILPSSGLLLIFADINYYSNRWEGEPDISMHLSSPESLAVIYVPDKDFPRNVRRTDGCKDVPPATRIFFNREKPTIEDPDLQIFGRSDHLEWETWPKPCAHWPMLFQLDSMEDSGYIYNFVDWGVLCILVSPQSLATLDFSDARAIILST